LRCGNLVNVVFTSRFFLSEPTMLINWVYHFELVSLEGRLKGFKDYYFFRKMIDL